MSAIVNLVARSCSSNIVCPSCPSGESCVLIPPTESSCAEYVCVSDSTGTSSPSDSSSSHVDVGAIAGGVVGGIVVLGAIIGFLLWQFAFSSKAKMKRYAKKLEDSPDMSDLTPKVDAENDVFVTDPRGSGSIGLQEKSRMSSATLTSVNSSYTRASNVIPIAYIPGVVSRPGGDNNHSISQHMFRDSSLRNSSFSSDENIRASIATTNYRGSTAFVHSEEIATNAKPNLIQVGHGNNKGTTIGTNNISEESESAGGSGPLLIGQRMNAHSIRIGRNPPKGLQSELIEEKSDEEDSDAELDKVFDDVPPLPKLEDINVKKLESDDEIVEGADCIRTSSPLVNSPKFTQAPPIPAGPPPSRLSSRSALVAAGSANDILSKAESSLERNSSLNSPVPDTAVLSTKDSKEVSPNPNSHLHYSMQSSFDVPFLVEPMSNSQQQQQQQQLSSGNWQDDSGSTRSSYHSSFSRPMSTTSFNDSRQSRSYSVKPNGRDSEYIANDLPIEAFLYTRTHLNDSNEGRNSPFDDKYMIGNDDDK